MRTRGCSFPAAFTFFTYRVEALFEPTEALGTFWP